MHTKDKLAEELLLAGLPDMATKAREGHYHFLSPLEAPAMELDRDLVKAATPAALALRKRHHNGEFDATREESDEWAESADGKEAFNRLLKR